MGSLEGVFLRKYPTSAGFSQSQSRRNPAQKNNRHKRIRKKNKDKKFEHSNLKKRRKQQQSCVSLNLDIYHIMGFTFTAVFKGFPTL